MKSVEKAKLLKSIVETGAVLYQSSRYMVTGDGDGMAVTLYSLKDAECLSGENKQHGNFLLSSTFFQDEKAASFVCDLESAQAHKISTKVVDDWLSEYDNIMTTEYVGAKPAKKVLNSTKPKSAMRAPGR